MNTILKVFICRASLERKGVVLWSHSFQLGSQAPGTAAIPCNPESQRASLQIAEVLLPELLFKIEKFMNTSLSFLPLFRQRMTLSENVNPPVWFNVFPLSETSVSRSGFQSLVLDSPSASWPQAPHHSHLCHSHLGWWKPHHRKKSASMFPLSDGAHRHLQVNQVRVQVTTLVTKVPASSNRIGFRFKVVGMQAVKLQGSSPYRGVSVGDNAFLWS